MSDDDRKPYSKRLLVCVYDKRARYWGDIISVPNADVAARVVESLVRRDGTTYHDYPGDYAMYSIGEVADNGPQIEVTPLPATLLYEFASFVDEESHE